MERKQSKKLVVLYCRVSTDVQETSNQVLDLKRYCTARQWEITEIYEDKGISGVVDKRPALNRLLADARKKAFDAVVVTAFDRAARSLKHLTSLLEEFNYLGIDFVSLRELSKHKNKGQVYLVVTLQQDSFLLLFIIIIMTTK